MEDLIGLLLEIILDGSIELLPNKKVPKWIRIIISLVFISIIIGIMVLGIVLLKQSIIGGSILIVIGIFLLVGSIIEIRKYMKN